MTTATTVIADAARVIPKITVHGYQEPIVSEVNAAAKIATRAKVLEQVELSRTQEVERLTALAAQLAVPGRAGGSVRGLKLPDMYALQAFHGVDRLRSMPAESIERTLAQAHAVQRDDVAIIVNKLPTRTANMLRAELELRGAHPRLIKTTKATFVDGKAFDAKGVEIVRPEAAMAINAKSFKMIRWVGEGDTFMVNDIDSIAGSSSKTAMDELFAANNVASMPGVGNIRDVEGLIKAAEKYNYPLVVKVDVSSGGQGVFTALNEGDLHSIVNGVIEHGNKQPIFFAQEYRAPITTGPKESRLTFVNDVYDRSQLVAGYHRDGSIKGDIRQNGPNGSTFTRIHVSEGDPTLTEDGVAVALRGQEAMQGNLRSFGGDVYHAAPREADAAKGRTVEELLIELNPSSIPPDLDIEGLPRREQVIPRLADLLIWGSPENRILQGL